MTLTDFQYVRATAGDVSCPKCHASIGELCRSSKTGQPLTNNRSYHSDRERLHQEVRTTTVAIYTLRHDIPRTTLRKGEVVRAVIHKHSPTQLVIVSDDGGDATYRGMVLYTQDAAFEGYTSSSVEQGRTVSADYIRIYPN